MSPKATLSLPGDAQQRDLGGGWTLYYTPRQNGGEAWLAAVRDDVLSAPGTPAPVPDVPPPPDPPAALPIPPRGFNVRGLAHFDRQTQVAYAQKARAYAELVGYPTLMVRFYAPLVGLAYNLVAKRVKQTLTILDEHGLLGHVVITDSLGSNWHHGGNEWRQGTDRGHLHHRWYKERIYEQRYARLLDALPLDANNVVSWQLMNEPGTYGKRATPDDLPAFLAFVDWASAVVPTYDIGLVNSAHITGQPEFSIYQRPFSPRFVGIHMYQYEGKWYQPERAQADVAIARRLGLPVVIDELGVERGHGPRPEALRGLPVSGWDAASLWDFALTDGHADAQGAVVGRDERYIETFLGQPGTKKARTWRASR